MNVFFTLYYGPLIGPPCTSSSGNGQVVFAFAHNSSVNQFNWLQTRLDTFQMVLNSFDQAWMKLYPSHKLQMSMNVHPYIPLPLPTLLDNRISHNRHSRDIEHVWWALNNLNQLWSTLTIKKSFSTSVMTPSRTIPSHFENSMTLVKLTQSLRTGSINLERASTGFRPISSMSVAVFLNLTPTIPEVIQLTYRTQNNESIAFLKDMGWFSGISNSSKGECLCTICYLFVYLILHIIHHFTPRF
jgi:hypothetical protein